MKNFIDFIRERAVVGLAFGFVFGGAVSQLVSSLINDIINPVVGVVLGSVGDLKDQYISFFGRKILWGNFAIQLLNFIILAVVIYYIFKLFQLEKLVDKPKEKK